MFGLSLVLSNHTHYTQMELQFNVNESSCHILYNNVSDVSIHHESLIPHKYCHYASVSYLLQFYAFVNIYYQVLQNTGNSTW